MDKENEKNNIKSEVPTSGDAVGIRATLNNMGISNNSIGYDEASGYVTLNGKSLIKPTYLDDEAGVSYAPAADIRKSVVDFYKDSSNPVVRVSDAYAAAVGEYGLGSGGLSYGNGTVSIGGEPLNTMYIDDSGKAWARQQDVYDLAMQYVNRTGTESPNSLAERYASEYLSDINDSLDALRNREEFSYNPDDDPVYLAYRNKYLLEGDRAGRNAMADYSALTGGYANSAAVTAGAMANQYYAQQLTNVIPELAEQAYQRYYDDYMADIDVLDRMIDLYDKAYSNAAEANRQTANNVNYSAESVVERDNAAYDRELAESERYWNEKLSGQEYETGELENYWTDILNTQKAAEGDLKNKGYMLDNEEQSIYLEYYRHLLDSELANDESERRKREADTQKVYSGM